MMFLMFQTQLGKAESKKRKYGFPLNVKENYYYSVANAFDTSLHITAAVMFFT